MTEKQAEDLGIAVGQFFAQIIKDAIEAAPDAMTIATSARGIAWTKSGADGAWARRRALGEGRQTEAWCDAS